MVSLKKIFCLVMALLLLSFAGGLVRETSALSTEEEKKLGKKTIEEMEGRVEFVRDITLQAFIDRMGRSLGAQASPTPFEFKFYIIKGQDPNAIAIPGGYILVTTGLIVLTENEHEIAGVLSHEIAHVAARHVAQLMERMKKLNIVSLAAIVAGALAGGGGRTSQAVATTAMAMTETFALKYTREMEQEADQNSLHILTRAGYDPSGMISFLNRMNRVTLASVPKTPADLSTHPEVENRIALLENLIQIESKPGVSFRSTVDFKRIRNRAFVEERHPDAAVSHFESMIKADPQDVNGHIGLGLSFWKMGRLDKSLEIFQRALSLAPKEPEIWREVGAVYFLSGKLDQAIEALESLQSLVSERDLDADLQGLYYLARAYQEKGEAAKALPLFLRFRSEMPGFPGIHNHLGSVYGRTGQKGLSHLHFGKHFKLRGEKQNALLHFSTALQWLAKESPEREEAEREIRELRRGKGEKPKR